MSLLGKYSNIWRDQKRGGYKVKRFTIRASEAFNLAWEISGTIPPGPVVFGPYWRENHEFRRKRAKKIEEEILKGNCTLFGLPVRVTPSFNEVVTEVLFRKRGQLDDITSKYNSFLARHTEDSDRFMVGT